MPRSVFLTLLWKCFNGGNFLLDYSKKHHLLDDLAVFRIEFRAKHGVRKSENDHCDDCGKDRSKPGRLFAIDQEGNQSDDKKRFIIYEIPAIWYANLRIIPPNKKHKKMAMSIAHRQHYNSCLIDYFDTIITSFVRYYCQE